MLPQISVKSTCSRAPKSFPGFSDVQFAQRIIWRVWDLPAICVTDARGGVPRHGDHLVIAFLNPDRAFSAQVDHSPQRDAAVEPVSYLTVAGVAGNAALYPGVPAN